MIQTIPRSVQLTKEWDTAGLRSADADTAIDEPASALARGLGPVPLVDSDSRAADAAAAVPALVKDQLALLSWK